MSAHFEQFLFTYLTRIRVLWTDHPLTSEPLERLRLNRVRTPPLTATTGTLPPIIMLCHNAGLKCKSLAIHHHHHPPRHLNSSYHPIELHPQNLFLIRATKANQTQLNKRIATANSNNNNNTQQVLQPSPVIIIIIPQEIIPLAILH